MGNQPYIVGVGAANLDLNGASCAPIHLRDSNPGHISLSAGEMCIRDSKGIEHDAEPGRSGRRRGGAAVQDLRGDLACGISQQDLFGKAYAEAGRAVERVGGVKAARVDLPGDVGIACLLYTSRCV